MLAHVLLLRERTRPSRSDAVRLISASRFMRSRVSHGEAYMDLIRERTLPISAANPIGATGSMRQLMPLYIDTEVPRLKARPEKFQVTVEEGVDRECDEEYCLAFLEEK